MKVYLKDDLLQQGRQRRTVYDIQQILHAIHSSPPSFIKQVPSGFIVGFPRDNDVNFIIQCNTISLLKQQNLSAALSNNTRANREIKIVDIPQYIFNESEANILDDLEQKNGIKIVQFTTYTSPYTGMNVIKAVIDTKASKDVIVQRNTLKLCNSNLSVRNSSTAAQASSQQQNVAPPNPIPSTPSSQHQGQLLPRNSSWGNQSSSISSITNTSNANCGTVSSQPKFSESDRKFHVDSFKAICSHLSTGPVNPELFVYQFNLCLAHYGYSTISIPDNLIKSSKEACITKPSFQAPTSISSGSHSISTTSTSQHTQQPPSPTLTSHSDTSTPSQLSSHQTVPQSTINSTAASSPLTTQHVIINNTSNSQPINLPPNTSASQPILDTSSSLSPSPTPSDSLTHVSYIQTSSHISASSPTSSSQSPSDICNSSSPSLPQQHTQQPSITSSSSQTSSNLASNSNSGTSITSPLSSFIPAPHRRQSHTEPPQLSSHSI